MSDAAGGRCLEPWFAPGDRCAGIALDGLDRVVAGGTLAAALGGLRDLAGCFQTPVGGERLRVALERGVLLLGNFGQALAELLSGI